MTDARNAIVEWAKWGVINKHHFIYTEGAQRMAYQVSGYGRL
jgi:hypothetical protein